TIRIVLNRYYFCRDIPFVASKINYAIELLMTTPLVVHSDTACVVAPTRIILQRDDQLLGFLRLLALWRKHREIQRRLIPSRRGFRIVRFYRHDLPLLCLEEIDLLAFSQSHNGLFPI